MVSLRFPFLFSQPPKPANNGRAHGRSGSFSGATVACSAIAAAAAAGAAVSISQNPNNPFVQNALNFWLSNFSPNSNRFSPAWGSLSLAADQSPVTEPKTGVSFPAVLGDSQRLLGIGLRKKSVLGLKNIDVYAFGVYADDGDIKKTLAKKYGEVSVSELEEKKKLIDDLMESDVCTTVRLQIVYGKLSIRAVRSAFEESVGSRLQKFGGSDNKELLQRFTSQFKDEYKIPRGSIIDLSRERGYVLRTTIDGKEVGSIQSKLLCRSLLDLYIGEEPFDRQAKDDIEQKLVSVIQNF
ncbi:fatty-acid-binding protein 1 isoform X2 [Diospyros lotus]|uniref:fatty-acid-binding protein 1 isoform X2 n=1 Tax=Diospyros lotus TaxID=55363 RepID=UPI0022538DA5|nr:fatty-acid-binding protein 1 isoform X2 [Diospyros lotus]